MSKPAEIELNQLLMALDFLADVLEDGSLVGHYDAAARVEMAATIRLLSSKVKGLPQDVPDHLVQAAAVRAIVSAHENPEKTIVGEEDPLQHNMHKAEISANMHGHKLGPWQLVAPEDADPEYRAICQNCHGVVYVSSLAAYDLMLEDCAITQSSAGEKSISRDTIVALWDLSQREQE